MRLLILGGNSFLGKATARAALDAGDDVTCAARGVTGDAPDGARFVRIDRDEPDAYAAIDGNYDAVVDVSSRPSHVRAALAALSERVRHWVYVSSGSVYTDSATPNQRVEGSPIHDPAPPEVDDPFADGFVNYGPCKVACEQAVVASVGADRAFLCRAGLIVGPEDRSDRFTYWPERMARHGEVLAPGAPSDFVQWVDVRDLGAWLALAGRERIAGTYDGIGIPMPRAQFLLDVATGVGAGAPQLTWVDDVFLVEQGVNPWAGPRSLPMWLPLPEYAGFLTRDGSAARDAGLRARPLVDTARDTLEWSRARRASADGSATPAAGGSAVPGSAGTDDSPAQPARKAGLTADDEAEVLAAWRASRPA
ncbi:MAG TPA: NAD-dependent epimerase/dehydratase family protein [Micromonosporaceae bacterium]|jgi:nucleoside-diphosphate-sugar epimerase